MPLITTSPYAVESTEFTLNNISFVQSASVITNTPQIQGLFFKPDGLKMYTCGNVSDDVHEYDLSVAWDISTLSYLQTYVINDNLHFVEFKPDGSSLYVNFSQFAPYLINEHSMSTPWNISTASFEQSLNTTAVHAVGTMQLSPDGTKMLTSSNVDLAEWNLSTSPAFDISTATHVQTTTAPNSVHHFAVNPAGTKLISAFSVLLHEYTMSTPWDVSTLSFEQSFNISAQESSPSAVHFKPDGTRLFVAGPGSDSVHEYDLT